MQRATDGTKSKNVMHGPLPFPPPFSPSTTLAPAYNPGPPHWGPRGREAPPPWGTQTHLQVQKPAHAGSRTLMGLMLRVSNVLWLLFANDLPTVMFFLGPFSFLPLSFLGRSRHKVLHL